MSAEQPARVERGSFSAIARGSPLSTHTRPSPGRCRMAATRRKLTPRRQPGGFRVRPYCDMGGLANAEEEAIYLAALRQGLRDSGYVEGENVVLEMRFP